VTFNDASDDELAPILNLAYGSPDGTYYQTTHKTLPVYPVPTSGPLTIGIDSQTIESIEIFNIMGEVVLSPEGFDSTIDLSLLPNGSYILRVTTEEGVSSKRIIKR
jgi:hypothetical protein